MPVSIGTMDIPNDGEIYVGTSQVTHIYQGVTQIWPVDDTDPVDPLDPVVRNTYTDYACQNTPTVETNTTTGAWSAWASTATPATSQFLLEARSRTVTTVTVRSCTLIRSCTAVGGCDGPFTDDFVDTDIDTNTERETRDSSTPNPQYEVAISNTQICDAIDVDIAVNGDVTVSFDSGVYDFRNPEFGGWEVSLVSGQESNVGMLNVGDPVETHRIRVNVVGQIPVGFTGSGNFLGGNNDGVNVTCNGRQQAPAPPAPPLTATVSWRDSFGAQSATARDGSSIPITAIRFDVTPNTTANTTTTISPSDGGPYVAGVDTTFTITSTANANNTIYTGSTTIRFTVEFRSSPDTGGGIEF